MASSPNRLFRHIPPAAPPLQARAPRDRPRYPTLSTGGPSAPAAGPAIRAAQGEINGRRTDGGARRRTQTLPHNIEAEQALLGALLVNNDVYDRVASIVQPEHFFDPVHARIFEVAAERIRRTRSPPR